MRSDIESLLVLQDRDRRLLELRRQLEQLPTDKARAESRLEGDTNAVASARKTLQEKEVEIKKVELDVETRRNTVARLRQQQFETRKNDEYTALGHEVDRYTADIDAFETRELELMEEADQLRERLREAEASLSKSREVVAEDLRNIEARHQRLQADADDLAVERDRLAGGIDAALIKLYDRLMKTKNGLAVVGASGGQCGGCHVRLVPATQIKVTAGKEITQCENCGRILHSAE